jgi:hypothetical protein
MMRLFQNSGVPPAYLPRLSQLTRHGASFASRRDAFLHDRYGAPHILEPIFRSDPAAFFTNGNDEVLQHTWARENGMSRKASLEEILVAQIEHHRTEVFYNLDPISYGGAFVRKLPGFVKRKIAWRAALAPGANLAPYDLVLSNFPSIMKSHQERGWRPAYFSPSYDPETNAYAGNADRPVDIIFIGGFSRVHQRRVEILEAVAALAKVYTVAIHLERSRLTRLAESPVGRLLPLASHRRPANIRAVSRGSLFGRDLYKALSRAKIALNGATDIAGDERGNMRCFEAHGCGALHLTDEGKYPEGFVAGENMVTYRGPRGAVEQIVRYLSDWESAARIARAGTEMVREKYGKSAQWASFQALVDGAGNVSNR